MRRNAIVGLLLTAMLGISGCGGGGSGDAKNTPKVVLTGKLYDSSVSGVRYSTASQSGYTDAVGSFKYVEGEVVIFRIGDFVLGQAKGAPIIIPPALQDANGVSVDSALSLRLLQTLDSDNDPSNGITIPDDTYPVGHLANITSETAAQTFLNSLKIKKTLVSETSALGHFTTSLENPPDSGAIPSAAVAPLSYTKLHAVTTTRVLNSGLSEPDPKCTMDHVGNVSVKRSSSTWTPESVTVRINQSDYMLPGPPYNFENESSRIFFRQPEYLNSTNFLFVSNNTTSDTPRVFWALQQYFDYGMGVVTYFDKAAGCFYKVLVRDDSWYAQKNNLTARSELFKGSISLTDGCPGFMSTSTNGTGITSCLVPGDKWFMYYSSVFDPDGYVARLDWKVDLDGAAWIDGSCQSGVVGKGEIVRANGKVNWSCDHHNQVSLTVHLNWLNPTIAEGYPEHKVTLTPYDDKLQKGAEATLTVAGKPLPPSAKRCVKVTYGQYSEYSKSFCVNSSNFIDGPQVTLDIDSAIAETFNAGCLIKSELYDTDIFTPFVYSATVLSGSTCQPNVDSTYTYNSTQTNIDEIGNTTSKNTVSANALPGIIPSGLDNYCAQLSLSGGSCQSIPSVTIPAEIIAMRGNSSCTGGQVLVGTTCQCPSGQALVNGICVAAPVIGVADANGCFLVDPKLLGVNAVRGNYLLGAAKVTLTNSSSLRVVANVEFTGNTPADKGQIAVVANGTNNWTGGASGLTGYKVEYWGSTKSANDFICHKPEFTQFKAGSL